MKTASTWLVSVLLCAFGIAVLAQAPAEKRVPVVGDKEPVLRVEAGGPTAFVTSLAFSNDGNTLYAAGQDKVVRVWTRDPQQQPERFRLEQAAYRIPIGPGMNGAINGIALSPDGQWLAVAANGVMRGGAGFRQLGLWLPLAEAITPDMRLDQGTIYVFNTKDQSVRRLVGHGGPVLSLAFAALQKGKPPVLVSTSRERDADASKYVGGVRMWNVAESRELANYVGLPDPEARRPGLAAWHTGPKPNQTLVALAFYDGNFRVWDVTAKRIWKVDDGQRNESLALLLDQKKVLTCSFRERNGALRDGALQLWDVQKPQMQEGRSVTFPPQEGPTFYVPYSLTVFPSRPGADADHAAVVFWIQAGDDEYFSLRLVKLATLKTVKTVRLWEGRNELPVVTADAAGRHIAVAGNRDHRILVYSVADLLREEQPEPQLLRSNGDILRYCAFGMKGNKLGLWLNEKAKPRPGARPRDPDPVDMIFSFSDRKLTADQEGWAVTPVPLNGWNVEFAPPKKPTDRPSFILRRGNRREGITTLDRDIKGVTDFALLPPAALNVPILAVAYLDSHRQPWLSLYNAATGELVRQLTGHVAPGIDCLAFSADGKLLASAGEDQTVCLWSMTDLGNVLGKQGMLKGVAVAEKKEGQKNLLVVSQVDDDSPAAEQGLKKGDIVEGIVGKDGKLQSKDTALAFYNAVSQVKPQQEVTLQVSDGKQRKKISIAVNQGIDERKPLLSLFVTRGQDAAERDWIAWNPSGPYDRNDRRAERYLIWHLHTGKEDQPAVAVLADQYRKEYLGDEGFLKRLVEKGQLEKESKAKPLDPPTMTLWIDEIGPDPDKLDSNGQVLVRDKSVTLKLGIDNFPLDRIASLQWQVDKSKAGGFEASPERERTAELTGYFQGQGWKRGVYQVKAVLRTKEATPKEYAKELTLRYQPLPPDIDPKTKPTPVVTKPEFSLRAVVRPVKGEKAHMELTHAHGGKKSVVKEWDDSGPLSIDSKVTLKEGVNRIELVAKNQDALSGFKDLEENRLTFVVSYQEKIPELRLSLNSVLTERGEASERQTIEPGTPVIVSVSKARIEGLIKSDKNLDKAELINGKSERLLDKFAAGKGKEFVVDEPVSLEPGSNVFQVRAVSGKGKAEGSVTIEFRPRPPEIVLTAPDTVHDDGKGAASVRVEGRLVMSAEHRKRTYEAVVLLNGQPVKEKPELDGDRLSVRVPLTGRDNAIQVKLTDSEKKWDLSRTSERVAVRYLRPPRNIQIAKPQVAKAKKSLTDITAQVDSVPKLTGVEVEINGRPIKPSAEMKQAEGNAWTVVLKDVPLDEGTNRLTLWASNVEARSQTPGMVEFEFQRPKAAKAEVAFTDPKADVNVPNSLYKVQFRVRSDSGLSRVQLVRGDQVLFTAPAARLQKPDSQELVELTEAVDVPLDPGVNRLEAVAVNDGGEQRAAVVLSYLLPPVQVQYQSLETETKQLVTPRRLPQGGWVFDQVPEGQLTLRGRVNCAIEKDDQLKEGDLVRVYVNGFQQLFGKLKAVRQKENRQEADFEAKIVLTRPRDNLIRIKLPGQKEAADSHGDARVVQCDHPVAGQSLHLLVVGVGEMEKDKVTDRVRTLLESRAAKGGPGLAAFEEVRVTTLPPYFTRDGLSARLRTISREIQKQIKAGRPNHVVMIYYHGSQSVTPEGTFFDTPESLAYPKIPLPQTGIAWDSLASFFEGNLGAQLLFLDVANSAYAGKDKDLIVQGDREPNVGVVRITRMNGGERDIALRGMEAEWPKAAFLRELIGRLDVWSRLHKDALRLDESVAVGLGDLVLNLRP